MSFLSGKGRLALQVGVWIAAKITQPTTAIHRKLSAGPAFSSRRGHSGVAPASLEIVGPACAAAFVQPVGGWLVAASVGARHVAYRTADGSGITPRHVDSRPLQETHTLVRCAVDLLLEAKAATPAAVQAALSTLEVVLCSPATLFLVKRTSTQPGLETEFMLAGSDTLASLGGSWQQPVMMQMSMRPGAADTEPSVAPIAAFQPGITDINCSALRLDVLCYAPAGMPASKAALDVVQPALAAQLRAMAREAAAATADTRSLSPLRALHFLPPGLCHHITLIYPLPCAANEAD